MPSENSKICQDKLRGVIETDGVDVPEHDKASMLETISEFHDVFALEEGERGETDLMEMQIDTAESPPIKQPPTACHLLFVEK